MSKLTHLLEMQRWILWVLLEQLVTLISEFLNFTLQSSIAIPKIWGGSVSHKSVQRSSRKSCNAFSAPSYQHPGGEEAGGVGINPNCTRIAALS